MGQPLDERFYDFDERLAWSRGATSTGDVASILLDRIPAATGIRKAKLAEDRQGTDYWVDRDHGLPPLSVDVKTRQSSRHKKNDVALESWSVFRQKIGWTRDETKRTDYVLFYWADTHQFLLLAFPLLCRTFRQFGQGWRIQYRTAKQSSGDYQSQCIFVPIPVLLDAINECCQDTLSTRKDQLDINTRPPGPKQQNEHTAQQRKTGSLFSAPTQRRHTQ